MALKETIFEIEAENGPLTVRRLSAAPVETPAEVWYGKGTVGPFFEEKHDEEE